MERKLKAHVCPELIEFCRCDGTNPAHAVLLEEMLRTDKTVYWCYNETFGHYHDVPLAGKRAHDFITKKNECKGGHWVLHTKEQYTEWQQTKGKHLEWIATMNKLGQ